MRGRHSTNDTSRPAPGRQVGPRDHQEVMILREDHAAQTRCAFYVPFVVGLTEKPLFRGGDDVHSAAAKTGNDPPIHAFVGIESKRHRRLQACSGAETPGVARAKVCDQRFGLRPVAANGLRMVVEIPESGMHVRQGQMGVRFNDLVGRHPEVLELARDLADLDVGTGNDRSGSRIVDARPGAGLDGRHPILLASRGVPANAVAAQRDDGLARRPQC